jgi:signal transduction histidine kinase
MAKTNLSNLAVGNAGLGVENMLRDLPFRSVVVVDAQDRVVFSTQDAEQILAPTAAKAGAAAAGLPATLLKLIRQVRSSGHPIRERQVKLSSPGGNPVTLSVTADPLPASGGAGLVVASFKDISPGGKLEHSLRRLDRLASVGTLSATMAHEIKNALVAIRTFTELLLEKHQDSELAGVVRRELSRVDSIVSNMLKFSAPAQPTLSPVRLHEILEHSLRLVQHRAASKTIEFQREFQATPDTFQGDDHQLEQAFVNLLFNAVEAIPAEGALTIATDWTPDDTRLMLHETGPAHALLRVKITDTGPGIPPENLDNIFELFFTTKPNGTGIGLPVTRRIVEEHGGTIRVESQLGKGTTFTVLLPVARS